jgi:hypothetical protein
MRAKTVQLGFLTPRSIFIIVVLLAILLIPLWWLGDKAERAASRLAKENTIAQGTPTASSASAPNSPRSPSATSPATIVPIADSSSVNNPDAFGLTWGQLADEKLPADAVAMSCHGLPKEGISQPHAGSCNPYAGDSSCRFALPVLCFYQTGSSEGTTIGQLASSQPVAGFVLGSAAQASARCEKELGSGWRMAEHHDGGGWSLTAKRSAQLDTRLRHWVHINNQPGNCWNNKG